MRMRTAILVLALAHGLAACGGSKSPSAPTPTPTPVPPQIIPQPTGVQVTGFVADSAFRSLAGARVEVLDGPQAGTWAMSDATGQFSLTGTFDDTTRFRATSDGHVATIGTLSPACTGTCNPARRYMYFSMAVLAPPVEIAGDYTLTFIADSTCEDLPDELRTRTYTATIAPGSNSHSPANTFFWVTVSGVPLLHHYEGFPVGVAGDLVAFELRGEGPYLVEEFEPNSYIGFDGRAEASVGSSRVSTISTSFEGWIDYCKLKSPMGTYFECTPAQAVAQSRCESKNHRLVLVRR